MATKTFFGKDTTGSPCTAAAFCSGRTLSGSFFNTLLATETLADLTAVSYSLASSETTRVFGVIECRPAVAAYASGPYGVTIDITGANMNLTLDEIHLCRVSSACGAVSTIGSLTGIARSLGSTGAVTHNVTGSADTNGSTDKLLALLVATNGAMSLQSVTAKVTIASPIDSAPATSSPPWYATHRPRHLTPKRRFI